MLAAAAAMEVVRAVVRMWTGGVTFANSSQVVMAAAQLEATVVLQAVATAAVVVTAAAVEVVTVEAVPTEGDHTAAAVVGMVRAATVWARLVTISENPPGMLLQ